MSEGSGDEKATCSQQLPDTVKPGAPVASESWSARVLRARGVSNKSDPRDQAKMYNRFMKRLRAKACKFRRRLDEGAGVIDAVEGLDVPVDAITERRCRELHEVCPPPMCPASLRRLWLLGSCFHARSPLPPALLPLSLLVAGSLSTLSGALFLAVSQRHRSLA